MGGKSTTSTQQVSIPPEVLARYNAVNRRAENVAQKPFQQYGGEFVAPINQQQQAGFGNINQAATSAQPYFNAASGMTLYGSQGVGPLTGGQINQYMSPYLNNVASTTLGNLSQEQAIQRQGQIGDAIKAGAYGSDRSGLAAANLGRQQAMAFGKTAADLYNTGYGQAVQTAVGQQGIQAQDLSRMLQGGAQLGQLGTAQQGAALQGAQAQVGAGTLAQQTSQAQKTAEYQQFLQERGYDFQVAQFLANIAMGTGALSGSTTTTTQPQSLFSDERLKENVEPVGELNDGQTIYRYNYKGDPRTQIGLIAQDVERSHPEAVGESEGYRTVDYGRATDDAAMASRGGLVPEGMERMAFAPGGMVDPNDMQALIASQAQSFGPFSQAGLYGGDKGGGLGKSGYVPGASLPVGKLMTAGAAPQQKPSALAEAMSAAEKMGDLGSKAAKGYDVGRRGLFGSAATEGTEQKPGQAATRGLAGIGGEYDPKAGYASGIGAGAPADVSDIADKFLRASGGLVPGYAGGGGTNPYEMNADPLQDVLEDQSKNEIEPLKPASAPGGGGSSGLGDAIKVAGQVASMFAASDARLKDNIEPVGKLYDGQPVYRYDMGGGPTQIGLMAQEAGLRRPDAVGERDGYMTLDYDRATEDAAGLMPRRGFAGGGGVDDLRQIIIEEAERRGIPPALALRQAQVESSMNPAARGKAGEIGLFQVMPSTARQPGYGVKPVDPAELDDPRRNAGFGLDYLKARAERLGVKDWSNPEETARGLRAYNGGGDPRYVQKILGPGLEGARAYTGDARPASASSAIDQAAPRGGLSAPESAPGKPDNKVLGLSPPNQFGTDKEQGWGDFLSSRQFIVPLLSAVGAAATTPTRNLGTAIAAGLGAGAQAYGGLEKEQADIKKTGVETALKTQELSRKGFFTEGGVTLVQTPEGRIFTIDKWIEAGQPTPIGGDATAETVRSVARKAGLLKDEKITPEGVKAAPAPAEAVKPPAAEVKEPAKPGEPASATTEPRVESATAPPASGNYTFSVIPTPDAVADMKKEATSQLTAGPARETKIAEAQAQRDSIVKQRDASAAMVGPLNELATALVSYNQNGVLQTGFGADAYVQFNRVLNSMLRAVGAPKGWESEIPTAANIEDKVSRLITEAKAGNLDQRAVTALDKLKEGIANRRMEPDAIADILSELFVERQKALDRGAYLDKVSRATRDIPGSQVGSSVDANFKKQFSEQEYAKDRAIIKSIILGGEGGLIKTAQGREPIINYVLNKGKDVPLQRRLNESGIGSMIDKKYGRPGLARFFLGVAN